MKKRYVIRNPIDFTYFRLFGDNLSWYEKIKLATQFDSEHSVRIEIDTNENLKYIEHLEIVTIYTR